MKKHEEEGWVSYIKEKHKEIFSELDVLLRALDRFFYIDNLPFNNNEDITNKNFYEELTVVRDAIFKILGILEIVIPENKKNVYWFQKFAEYKFLTDHRRDLIKQELYNQDTPEKGLYLLYDVFINLKGIVADLLKSNNISYLGFINVGHIISKEIRENRFFNPFRKRINPEFDRIDNQKISNIVKSIKDRENRKFISIIYLYLFRFLRYLSYVDITSQYSIPLSSSLLILILLRTEISEFQEYIKETIKKMNDGKLKIILTSISFQFSMETKRVYLQELKDILRKKTPQHFRGKVENSHGILKNLTEQTVVQLAQFYRPDIQGTDIFKSFITRLEQSLKLREDMFALHKFLKLFLEKADLPEERNRTFESLKNFMLYFESFTFKLLRYDDYDEFSSFFNYILSLKEEEYDFNKILEKTYNFNIFLETTIRHLSNRAEYKDNPLDMKNVEKLLVQYL